MICIVNIIDIQNFKLTCNSRHNIGNSNDSNPNHFPSSAQVLREVFETDSNTWSMAWFTYHSVLFDLGKFLAVTFHLWHFFHKTFAKRRVFKEFSLESFLQILSIFITWDLQVINPSELTVICQGLLPSTTLLRQCSWRGKGCWKQYTELIVPNLLISNSKF